jgi:hypothetical protein
MKLTAGKPKCAFFADYGQCAVVVGQNRYLVSVTGEADLRAVRKKDRNPGRPRFVALLKSGELLFWPTPDKDYELERYEPPVKGFAA